MSKNASDLGLIYFADGTTEGIAEYTLDEGVMIIKGSSDHLYKFKPAMDGRMGKFYERRLMITKLNDDGSCDYDISWVKCEIEYVKLK